MCRRPASYHAMIAPSRREVEFSLPQYLPGTSRGERHYGSAVSHSYRPVWSSQSVVDEGLTFVIPRDAMSLGYRAGAG
jgi:hypothetical protein